MGIVLSVVFRTLDIEKVEMCDVEDVQSVNFCIGGQWYVKVMIELLFDYRTNLSVAVIREMGHWRDKSIVWWPWRIATSPRNV